MDAVQFLKSREWHKMGRWKFNIIQPENNGTALMDPMYGASLPYAPSSYNWLNHEQYLPAGEYKEHIAASTELLENNFAEITGALKNEVHQTVREGQALTLPATLTPKVLFEILRIPGFQSRHWYEIMLCDGALATLYPKSLPSEFQLKGETHTSSSLLARAALPKKLFPMIAEQYHLLEIAQLVKEGKDAEMELETHVKKYSWMNSLAWWDEPFGKHHYLAQAKELAKGEPQKMLEEKKAKRRAQYEHAERLLEALESKFPKAHQYLDGVRELADLREENWDIVSLVGVWARPLFRKEAAHHGLSTRQFMQLSQGEMVYALENNSLPKGVDEHELNLRMENYAVINVKGEKTRIFSGLQAAQLYAIVNKEAPAMHELKGMPVWQGIVKGKVCKLEISDDIGKMKEGFVLVCPMSDPDYMPAIQKAAAIVADQGGLLCHAAIVARELQIPCIVGTEYATKLLNDGDEVEVDAIKGIVRKL